MRASPDEVAAASLPHAGARPRVGLVLGGGGFPGMAFHAGTLLALHHDLGWDPRCADVIVGTSAGSVIASLLRAGLDTDDLASWTGQVPPRPAGLSARHAIERVGEVGLRLRPPAMRWPSRRIFGSTLGFGVLDGSIALREIDALFPGWPADPLRIACVRLEDGHRVVFGRDHIAPVPTVVAASCAIPGIFRPIRIDGSWYVDGGVRSPTNADVLIGEPIDLAVVLSPMTQTVGGSGRSSRWRPDAPLRAMARRRLDAELAQLERAGIPALVFEADAHAVRAGGWNGLSRAKVGDVAQAAFLSALAGIHERPDRLRLAALLSRCADPTARSVGRGGPSLSTADPMSAS